MQEIEKLKRKIKICNLISLLFIIVTIVVMALEYIIAQYFPNRGWTLPVLRILIYGFYVLPVGIILPVFFRVNYKNKLIIAMRKK